MFNALATLGKSLSKFGKPLSKISEWLAKTFPIWGPVVIDKALSGGSLKDRVNELESINYQQHQTIQELQSKINTLSYRIVLISIILGSLLLISITVLITVISIK